MSYSRLIALSCLFSFALFSFAAIAIADDGAVQRELDRFGIRPATPEEQKKMNEERGQGPAPTPTPPPKPANPGSATNNGNSNVVLTVKTEGGADHVIQLTPGQTQPLPAGSTRVKVNRDPLNPPGENTTVNVNINNPNGTTSNINRFNGKQDVQTQPVTPAPATTGGTGGTGAGTSPNGAGSPGQNPTPTPPKAVGEQTSLFPGSVTPNGDLVVVGGGPGNDTIQVFQSTDGGATWHPQAPIVNGPSGNDTFLNPDCVGTNCTNPGEPFFGDRPFFAQDSGGFPGGLFTPPPGAGRWGDYDSQHLGRDTQFISMQTETRNNLGPFFGFADTEQVLSNEFRQPVIQTRGDQQ